MNEFKHNEMLAFKEVVLVFVLFLIAVGTSYACECEPKDKLDISDWNNTELIMEAELVLYKKSFQAVHMKFDFHKLHKGEEPPTQIDIFIPNNKQHSLLHAIPNPKVGESWILFIRKEIKENKTFYRIQDSSDVDFCGLSRPIKDDDGYLVFLEDVFNTSEGMREYFNHDNQLVAKGMFQKHIPEGKWEYHDHASKSYFTGKYKNGKKDGEWEKYTYAFKEEHILLDIYRYDNGKLKTSKHFNYIGEIKSSTKYFEDYKIVDMYYKGIVRKSITKSYDNKVLFYKKFDEEGKLIEQKDLMED